MLITLQQVSYYTDKHLLLEDVNFSVNPGDKIAIVGANGSGKSTLLSILAGELAYQSGERSIQKDARVLLVKQQWPDQKETPLDFLKLQDPVLQKLYRRAQRASDEDLSDIYNEIAEWEGEHYERAAPAILRGLGITDKQQQAPISQLSGGMQMRLSLAAALVQSPDILLIDEPTNHLDLPSVFWLTEFLANYPKAVVVVSHDIDLLNTISTKTYHLQQGHLTCYKGNYESYREQYELHQQQAIEINKNLDKKHKATELFVAQHIALPKWSRMAQTRKRQMEKENAERPTIVHEATPITIQFPECSELQDPILDVQNATIGYDKKTVLSEVNLSVQAHARIGILGRNGQGKSTFAKLLASQLEPTEGVIIANPRLRTAYFSQDHADLIHSDMTTYEHVAAALGDVKDHEIRQFLAKFGFTEEFVDRKSSELSGGEKTRLQFALIVATKPHLIVMDEPTNHLDIQTKEALINAIKKFNGAIILISHDWDLLKKTTDTYLLARNGKMQPFTRGLEVYKTLCTQPQTKAATSKASTSGSVTKGGMFTPKDDKGKEKEVQKKNLPEKKQQHGMGKRRN